MPVALASLRMMVKRRIAQAEGTVPANPAPQRGNAAKRKVVA
jgi:hypothetical protein